MRPLEPDDFDATYAAASDPLIWEQHPAKDRHKREVFERFFSDAMKSGGALLAVDPKDGRATRVGIEVIDGKRVRVARRSGTRID